MKTTATAALLASGLVLASLSWADHHEEENGSWFDQGTCSSCKTRSSNAELMQSMKWETHKTEKGLLMVSMVPAEKLKEFESCCKKMDQTAKDIASGKTKADELCGFCDSMGELMEAGAKMQKIKTQFGMITLITAEEPETIAMIHKHARRTVDEAKKLSGPVELR